MLYFRNLMLSERFSPELTDDHFVKRKKNGYWLNFFLKKKNSKNTSLKKIDLFEWVNAKKYEADLFFEVCKEEATWNSWKKNQIKMFSFALVRGTQKQKQKEKFCSARKTARLTNYLVILNCTNQFFFYVMCPFST